MDESVVTEFEKQQVGTLKLSNAIRIGASKRPQCKHRYFDNGGSCALGAAWEGIGRESDLDGYYDLMEAFGVSQALCERIGRRNDRGETREQIADWLESIGH